MNHDTTHSVLIIGVGNEERGDDGAGLAAARLILRQSPLLSVVEASGEGTALIELWRSFAGQTVYLIDAIVSGRLPGSVTRFDARRESFPLTEHGSSSHMFGVGQAIELGRVLDVLPPALIIYGIEGRCFEMGIGFSAEVEAGARNAAERVIAECQSASAGTSAN
jgi:hydrogenase maturation protease